MPERINKLQPDRTVYLRGFDSFAAAASIHSASPTGFTVSGTFRDPADFAVAVLYDADNFYEHPSIKYLPDFNLAGLTLTFDLNYTDGLQPIDSPKYNWIDWATLDCIRADGTTAQVQLFSNATLAGTSFPAASATCNVVTTSTGIQPYDRVTLWFQNLAWDYIAPNALPSVEYQFFAGGTGTVHSITIDGTTYSHTESDPAGESSAEQAAALITAIAAIGDPNIVASAGSVPNAVLLTVQLGKAGVSIPVSASDGNASVTLLLNTPALVAANLVAQINSTNWISSISGTVNVDSTGLSVTWASGADFGGIAAGSTILIAGHLYTVAGVQSATQLTLRSAAPTASGAAYVTWISSLTHALLASNNGAQITLTAARYGIVNVDSTGLVVTWISGAVFGGITAGSAILIAGAPYTVASVQSPTQLTLQSAAPAVSGAAYVAPRGGRDGNLIQLYSLAKTNSLALDQTQLQLSGGSSAVTWNVTIDFTANGIDQLRQCWLTFAPSLTNAPYQSTEWQAVFSNWQLSGPVSTQALTVAGPGSVRIEENNSACAYQGVWTTEAGFYSKYFANATSDLTASVTVTYACQFTHNLYIGTSLYIDRGTAGISLDGDTQTTLNCYLNTGSAVVTRRRVRTSVAPGRHTVTINLAAAGVFYFDFLEAAVPSDVPDALAPRTGISPALDFDTDHSYQLTPARIMWIMDQLGYAGPMNEYLGVFWWNERVLSGGSLSTAQISFPGPYNGGDTVFVTLDGTTLGKTVFPADTPATVANHFAAYINSTFVAAWASASGSVLTITGRSPAPAYNLTLTVSANATITQAPQPGVYGTWVVNDAINPPINRGTRDWHADFYAQCASRTRPVVTSCSMELVNPPAGYTALFPDTARTPVSTATGFASLVSNQCAVGASKMLAYQKAVYRNIAQMQAAAGLTPSVQYGEFLWWYFAGPGGMGFYDDETMAAAQTALGRPLHVFGTPNDDPTVNGGADALFLRNRLRDHVAALVADLKSAYPTTKCEVLWPYDVNYPTPLATGGGQLNRYINLPVEWQLQSTSGLDTMKVEALAFATSLRNINLSREAIDLFPDFGWPVTALRYLVPVFAAATPWHRELALAIGAGIVTNNLWAFDHVCLYNLTVPEPTLERRSLVQTR